MQKPQKAAAEAEAERHGRIGLEDQRRVVELKFQNSVFEVVKTASVQRINAAEHHGLHFFISGQRLRRPASRKRYRIAHGYVLNGFDGRRDVADLACRKFAFRKRIGGKRAHFRNIVNGIGEESFDFIPHLYFAVAQAHEKDDAFVIVVIAVENKRLERLFRIAVGRGKILDDRFQQIVYVEALFCRYAGRIA